MASAQQPAPTQQLQDQILAHTVYYAASKSPIKDDVIQLAQCWKTGSGILTKQEAGLLLWYHSQRDGDGCAEVLAAGVVAPSLDVLDSSTALQADKSTAAGLLLSLCADDKGKEQLVKSKASGANGSSCCQVLHGCLANPEAAPRHAMAILAALSSCPTALPVLLRALAGAIPWNTYIKLLDSSHEAAKDHATAIETAKYIQYLVSGRQGLALDAAASGVMEALLAATAAHKSAAAVRAGASCLLELCMSAPELRGRLGQLPGAMQKVVDLLGPPPATLIAWEQQQLKQQQMQSPHPQPTSPASTLSPVGPGPADADQQQLLGRQPHYSSISIRGSAGSVGSGGSNNGSKEQHVRVSERDSIRARSRHVVSGAGDGVTEADAGAREQPEQQNSIKTRRKSLRILNVTEGEAAVAAPAAAHATSSTGEVASSPTLRSKSLLGCLKQQGGPAYSKAPTNLRSSCPVLLRTPLLSVNSTALKWEGPVLDATRTAAAGLLAQLVLLPQLCNAASDRLAAPRLVVLLVNSMQQLAEASGKKGKSGGKKGSSKLAIPPDTEQLITHICVCLEFLVAGANADCYRVAAGGCLPALVRLATESRSTHLRQAAKAVAAQVVLVSETQHYVQQAAVPEELTALPDDTRVLVKLNDVDSTQLLIEFPAGAGLHALDDVTARARC